MASVNGELKYKADAYGVCDICQSTRQLSSLECSLFNLLNVLYTHGHIKVHKSQHGTHLCWECVSLLKHAKELITRAQISQGILKGTHLQFRSGKTLSHLKTTPVTYVNVEEIASGGQSQNQNLIVTNHDFDANSNDKYDIAGEFFDSKVIIKTDVTSTFIDNEPLKSADVEVEAKEEIKLEFVEQNLDNFDDDKSVSNEPFGKLTEQNVAKTPIRRYACYKNYETIPGMESAHKTMVKKVLLNEEQALSFMSRLRDKTISKSKRKYICGTCFRAFSNENMYKKHQSSNHSERVGKLECAFCSCRQPNRKKLQQHLRRHYYRFECVFCGIEFTKRHLAESHAFREHCRQLRCTHCPQVFKEYQDLSKHFVDTHSRYQCDYCSKIFKSRSNVIEHMRKRESLPCLVEGCGKKYCSRRSFESHRLSQHAPESLRYCVECDRLFATRALYQTHIYLHNSRNSQYKYVCKACGKVSNTKSLRDRHYNFVHLKKTNYYCKEHDKYFYSKHGLENHIKRIHLKLKNVKNKLCQTCGRYFSTNRVLIHHIRTHTGERPYACCVCSAAFAQKTAAYSHAKRAHPHLPKESVITFQKRNSNSYYNAAPHDEGRHAT